MPPGVNVNELEVSVICDKTSGHWPRNAFQWVLAAPMILTSKLVFAIFHSDNIDAQSAK